MQILKPRPLLAPTNERTKDLPIIAAYEMKAIVCNMGQPKLKIIHSLNNASKGLEIQVHQR